jgi:hypothetical protein
LLGFCCCRSSSVRNVVTVQVGDISVVSTPDDRAVWTLWKPNVSMSYNSVCCFLEVLHYQLSWCFLSNLMLN